MNTVSSLKRLSLIIGLGTLVKHTSFTPEGLQSPKPRSLHGAEATLAQGERVPLTQIDTYSLLLIPSIGDDLADAILDNKENLKNDCESFTAIKGIGAKKTKILCSYIDPSH